MKTRVSWFIFGFLACGLVSIGLVYFRSRNVDFTEFVPSDGRDMIAEALPWIRSSRMERVGGFLVVTPRDKNIGDAFINPITQPHFPIIMMHNSGSNGLPNSIQIWDRKMHSITLSSQREAGIWDSFAFETGVDSNSISYVDTNMDGIFDVRLGPH